MVARRKCVLGGWDARMLEGQKLRSKEGGESQEHIKGEPRIFKIPLASNS